MAEPVTEGWIAGAGRRLWHHRIDARDPIGGVLVLHGYSEHSGRYVHVLEALAARGFTCIAPTHRGHGRTATLPGLLRDANAVVQDWVWVTDALEHRVPDKPLFVLAHSMGALLAILLLTRDSRFSGAILNGTPLKVPDSISPASRLVARAVGGALPWLPVQPFFDATRATRDPAVHAASLSDPWIYKGWMRAGTGKTLLRALAEVDEAVPRLRIPLLITHGALDRTVAPEASARLHAAAGSADKPPLSPASEFNFRWCRWTPIRASRSISKTNSIWSRTGRS